MDFSKFTYAKGEPKQDAEYAVPGENLPLHESEEGGEEAKSTTDVSVSPNYQKPEGTLSPILVFVLSGGETRERNILKVLIQQKELGLMVKCTPERGHNALFFIPLQVFIML